MRMQQAGIFYVAPKIEYLVLSVNFAPLHNITPQRITQKQIETMNTFNK